MKPRVIDGSLWSETPRKIQIDLSGVRSFDEFTRAMEPDFPLEEDHREIWIAIRHWLHWQTCPLQIRVTGWSAFEKKMPRYADRLRHIFQTHVGRISVEYVDFDVPKSAAEKIQGEPDARPNASEPPPMSGGPAQA